MMGIKQEELMMGALGSKIKTILWVGAVAVFMSNPAFANGGIDIDVPLFDDLGNTKGNATAASCGRQSFDDVVSVVGIEPEGVFKGGWILTFGVDILGQDGLSGIYIEAKPRRKLTMAMENADYALLNEAINDLLVVLCDGTLVGALEIIKFDGTLSRDLDRLKIKFRSKFDWMDSEGKMRRGRLNFQSRFDDMRVAP
jgi:hypothetical protein